MINVKLLVLIIFIDIHKSYSEYCEICPSHTLCLYKNPGPSPSCHSYDKTASLTQDDVHNIVNKINQRRNFVALGRARNLPSAANMNKVSWSDELATFAQRWVDQCDVAIRPNLEDRCRNLADMKVGQNIATITGESPGLNVRSFVEIWFMEALDYNGSVTYYNQSLESKTNYFTQLIWAETSLVGCGKARFSIDARGTMVDRLVCNFAPRGNIQGKPVYTIGYPATQCKENFEKDDTFPGLCKPISVTTPKTTLTPAVSSLLRILNLPNSSLKPDIDPIRNDYKNREINNDEINLVRHQKMRHIPNNTHVIQHEVPVLPLNMHPPTNNPSRHDAFPHQHTPSQMQNIHGAIYKTRTPIDNYRRHNNFRETPNPYMNQNLRRHSVFGLCTRILAPNQAKNECNNINNNANSNCMNNNNNNNNIKEQCNNNNVKEECTRGIDGNEYILTTQPPCQKAEVKFTPHAFPHELCACNSQMTTCIPSTTPCTCNLNCRCFNLNNYAPGPHRRIPGEYAYYDNIQDFGMRGSGEVETRHLPKHNANSIQTTSSEPPNTKDEEYSENEYFTNKIKTFDFSNEKVQRRPNYRRHFQNPKYPFDSINRGQRKKRQMGDHLTQKPFWQMDDYDRRSQLKSLRYTTLLNKRQKKVRTTSPSHKPWIGTEPITIKVKDVTEHSHDNITEKFLSFDELMHLRKNSGGEIDFKIRRNEVEKTNTTVPVVTTTLFKPLKHCSRKVTCTWTAPDVTGNDGKVITGRGPLGESGSRTPPGYVDGCTRTSTCTREHMNRNRLANATATESGEGEPTPEEEDYCERRSLNLKRRDSDEDQTVQTLQTRTPLSSFIGHYKTDAENASTQVTNSMEYETTTEANGDCSCDDQESRGKRSICLHGDKSLKGKKNCKRQTYYNDLYFLVLSKILQLWENRKQRHHSNGCLCNSSHRTQWYNLNYLFIFLCYVSARN